MRGKGHEGELKNIRRLHRSEMEDSGDSGQHSRRSKNLCKLRNLWMVLAPLPNMQIKFCSRFDFINLGT